MSYRAVAAAAGLCALILGGAGHAVAAPANDPPRASEPIPIGAGTETDSADLDGKVGDGGCNVAAVGYDTFGNTVALTAGHCGDVGFTLLVGGTLPARST